MDKWRHAGDVWGAEHGQAFLDARSLLPRNASCALVDIGAHHGTVARMAAAAGCRVWAFEVNPKSLKILLKNVADAPYSSLVRVFTHERADAVVPADVRPTMVKIDVDGPDARVARGAARVLERAFSLHVEVAPRKQGGVRGSVAYMEFLKRRGFTLYPHWIYDPRGRFNASSELLLPPSATRVMATPATHAQRQLVRRCGAGARPIDDDAVLRLVRAGAEMDVWGVKASRC